MTTETPRAARVRALALLPPPSVLPLPLHTACGISWDERDKVRFLSKCVWRAGCLIYTGATSSGGASFDKKNNKRRGKGRKQYGSFSTKGKSVRAHKFFAVTFLGLRPGPGDELDHLCYNTRCVSCLECVPRSVNQARIRRSGGTTSVANDEQCR